MTRGLPWSFALLLVASLAAPGCRPRQAPAQPIAFNHHLHAGVQKIPCTDCHAGARKRAHAGLPSLRVCLGCHMKPQGNPPSPRERMVRERAAVKGPFRWIQVTRNPGHVYFSHAAHTALAHMPCVACHGDVTRWTRPPRLPEARLESMSTCMACHRQRGAPNTCLTCHK